MNIYNIQHIVEILKIDTRDERNVWDRTTTLE